MNPVHRVHFKCHQKLDFFCKSYNHINQKSIEQLGKQLLVKLEQKFPFPPGLRRGTLNVKVSQCQTYSEHLIVATLSILCLCPIPSNAGALVFSSQQSNGYPVQSTPSPKHSHVLIQSPLSHIVIIPQHPNHMKATV